VERTLLSAVFDLDLDLDLDFDLAFDLVERKQQWVPLDKSEGAVKDKDILCSA
jgi:hypothetical protein